MTVKEIDDLIKQGSEVIMFFGIRKNSYSISNKRITQKQFASAIGRWGDKLEFRHEGVGFTQHIYKLKS